MSLLKVAVRNLRRNRRRTAITMAALLVGVGAMVGVKGFMLGMRGMMLGNQMLGHLGAVQVHHTGYVQNVLGAPLTLDMADTPELRAAIASVPGVVAISPRLDFGAQLALPDKKPPPEDGSDLPEDDRGKTSFLMMTAFDPQVEQQVTPRRWEFMAQGRGAPFDKSDSTLIVLNDDFARGLEAQLLPVGAELPPVERQAALLSPDRDQALNGENVMVGATFASATPNDRRVGFMGLATAQRLLRMEGRVTEYGISIAPGADWDTVAADLRAKLGPDYEVHTWQERIPFVHQIVDTQDLVFGIVTTVFLLVVLLGIVNAMLMSVLERVREIGTMLAVGATRRQVASIFVLEGVVTGVVGGVLGVAIGVAWVVWANGHGIHLPAPGATVDSILRPEVKPLFVARALAQAVAGSALAALWPAWRASKLRPVEALSSV